MDVTDVSLASKGNVLCVEDHESEEYGRFSKDRVYYVEQIDKNYVDKFDFRKLVFLATDNMKRYSGNHALKLTPGEVFVCEPGQAQQLLTDFPDNFAFYDGDDQQVEIEIDESSDEYIPFEVATAQELDIEDEGPSVEGLAVCIVMTTKQSQRIEWVLDVYDVADAIFLVNGATDRTAWRAHDEFLYEDDEVYDQLLSSDTFDQQKKFFYTRKKTGFRTADDRNAYMKKCAEDLDLLPVFYSGGSVEVLEEIKEKIKEGDIPESGDVFKYDIEVL